MWMQIYYLDDFLGEVLTDRLIDVYEALDILGFDHEEYANKLGVDFLFNHRFKYKMSVASKGEE